MSALYQNIRELILLILTQLYFLSCTKKIYTKYEYGNFGVDKLFYYIDFL